MGGTSSTPSSVSALCANGLNDFVTEVNTFQEGQTSVELLLSGMRKISILQIFAKQFLSFKELNLDLTKEKLTVVVGPNDAGKSNVLRLVEYFLDCFSEPRSSFPKTHRFQNSKSGSARLHLGCLKCENSGHDARSNCQECASWHQFFFFVFRSSLRSMFRPKMRGPDNPLTSQDVVEKSEISRLADKIWQLMGVSGCRAVLEVCYGEEHHATANFFVKRNEKWMTVTEGLSFLSIDDLGLSHFSELLQRRWQESGNGGSLVVTQKTTVMQALLRHSVVILGQDYGLLESSNKLQMTDGLSSVACLNLIKTISSSNFLSNQGGLGLLESFLQSSRMNLPFMLASLRSATADRQALLERINAVTERILGITFLRFHDDQKGNVTIETQNQFELGFKRQGSDVVWPLTMASGASISGLCIGFAIHVAKDQAGSVFLDEPGASWHPYAQRILVDEFLEPLSQGKTVLVVTHSAHLLRPKARVLRLFRTVQSTSVCEPHKMIESAVADAPALFFASFAVLCEGKDDDRVVKQLQMVLRTENSSSGPLDFLNMSIFQVHGKPKLARWVEYCNALAIPCYVVADSDLIDGISSATRHQNNNAKKTWKEGRDEYLLWCRANSFAVTGDIIDYMAKRENDFQELVSNHFKKFKSKRNPWIAIALAKSFNAITEPGVLGGGHADNVHVTDSDLQKFVSYIVSLEDVLTKTFSKDFLNLVLKKNRSAVRRLIQVFETEDTFETFSSQLRHVLAELLHIFIWDENATGDLESALSTSVTKFLKGLVADEQKDLESALRLCISGDICNKGFVGTLSDFHLEHLVTVLIQDKENDAFQRFLQFVQDAGKSERRAAEKEAEEFKLTMAAEQAAEQAALRMAAEKLRINPERQADDGESE